MNKVETLIKNMSKGQIKYETKRGEKHGLSLHEWLEKKLKRNKEDKVGIIRLKDIKTPTTLEEFSENLKKYYFGYGKDSLYVKPEDGDADGIGYHLINSFDDIYKNTKSGFGGNGTSPSIVPMITNSTFQKLSDKICENMFDKTLSDEELDDVFDNVEVYEFSDKKRGEFMDMSIFWSKLDNKVMRRFYAKTLGEFSGYA